MRQLSCMSADVYCQKLNSHFYATTSFYVCARDGEWLNMELASVVKMAVGRMINYFGIF